MDDLPAAPPAAHLVQRASTGEEPYSIAMTVLETLGLQPVPMIASDIDTNVLPHGTGAASTAPARFGLSSSACAATIARHRRQCGQDEGRIRQRCIEFRRTT